MAQEPVIDNTQYYGERSGSNGHVIAFAVSEGRYTVAVAYEDGVIVMVPEPELSSLMSEVKSLTQLVTKMAQRLGMANHTTSYAAAAGVISLATMIADAQSGDDMVTGRGRLHSIGVAA